MVESILIKFPDKGRGNFMRVADYLVKQLEKIGVKHVFMVSGGGAMHLDDALGRSKIQFICNHHEQAAAIAAEGYARASGKLGVVFVTTGPGGTNTLTGLVGQWLDSVPVLFVSGQVKFETCIESCPEIPLRQLGDQEINIVDIVRPVTKYASMVKSPEDIKDQLEKAVSIALTPRFGPVWLDIPLDVQAASVDKYRFPDLEILQDWAFGKNKKLQEWVAKTIQALVRSKRPVLIVGHGVRLAQAEPLLIEFLKKLKIPTVTTFNGFDLLPSDHPLYIGRVGTIGDRAGNFAVQNSDLLICLGTRNNIRQVSYFWEAFGRCAKKIVVDIDEAELKKPTLRPDLAVHADVKDFLRKILERIKGLKTREWKEWIAWCRERKERYPTVLQDYRDPPQNVHPYYFVRVLTELLDERHVVVCGNGTACVVMFQAGIVKKGQRIFWNSGCASMGYDVPAAIGAWFATGHEIICLAGDGSIMMNIQELQTIKYHNLPIKIFVLNNEGYISIKQTQDSFFGGFRVGCDESSGVGFPNYTKLADGFGIPSCRIEKHDGLKARIKEVLNHKGPILCEVVLWPDYVFSPKLLSEKRADGKIMSKPLEDMYPYLDRDEFRANMIVPLLDEK